MSAFIYKLRFLLCATILVQCTPNIAQQIFIIGDNQADYSTITEAVAALHSMSLTDAVVFEMQAGVYAENVAINKVNGASAEHTITFRSVASAPNTVVIQRGQNNNVEPAIKIDEGDFIQFEGLIFEDRVTYFYDPLIHSINGQGNISFTNCQFIGDDQQGELLMVQNKSNATGRLLIADCTFTDAATALSTVFGSITINSSVFTNQTNIAARISNVHEMLIQDNQIQGAAIGLSLFGDTQQTLVNDNKLTNIRTTGINIKDFDGTVQTPHIIANNFIQLADAATGRCLYSNRSDFIHLLHNTMVNININATTPVLELEFSYGHELYNNIIANYGAGVVYQWEGHTNNDIYIGDYNNFYSAINNHFQLEDEKLTLAEWLYETGSEQHSLLADPALSTGTYYSSASPLRVAGIITDFSFDIDGNVRSDPPDIGVVNIPQPAYDLGLSGLISPVEPFANVAQQLNVELTNYGDPVMRSIDLHWFIDDVAQTPITVMLDLTTNESTIIELGTLPVSSSLTPQQVEVRIESDGITDAYSSNNQLTKMLAAALQGDYTIGSNVADFPTITAAAARLRQGGVVGAVNFIIQPGTYSERVEIKTFLGMGMENPVTFTSASGNAADVILRREQAGVHTSIFELERVAYINFEKISFFIDNESSGIEVNAIRLADSVNHINILNNIFYSALSDQHILLRTGKFVHGRGEKISHLVVKNNKMSNAHYGIHITNLSGEHFEEIEISNNEFMDVINNIFLDESSTITISQNLFRNQYPVNFNAIIIRDALGQINITKNQIKGYASNINIDGASYNPQQLVKRLLFANNYLYAQGDAGHNALEVTSLEEVKIYHNTIRDETQSDTPVDALNMTGYSGTAEVFNNIFVTRHPEHGSIKLNIFNDFSIDFDGNVYDIVQDGFIGTYNGTKVSELADWQIATNNAMRSMVTPVNFFDSTNYVTYGTTFNRIGVSTSVITDIENVLRNPQNPQPGVYEFTTPDLDAGVAEIITPTPQFLAGMQHIQAKIINYATTSINSIELNYQVNGQWATTTWTGILAGGDTVLVDLPNVVFADIIENTIQVAITSVNGDIDEFAFNDQLTKGKIYAGLSGVYTLGGNTSDFTNFADLTTTLERNGLAGAITIKVRAGQYEENVVIKNVPGSSAEHTILIQAEDDDPTSVILTAVIDGSIYEVLRLERMKYLTLRSLSFIPQGRSYRTLYFYENCVFIQIENCRIATPQGGEALVIVDSYDYPFGNSRNIHIENNIFTGVGDAIELSHKNRSLTVADRSHSVTIIDNQFKNIGIALKALRFRDIIFRNNVVMDSYSALSFEECGGELEIRDNKITSRGGVGLYFENNLYTATQPVQIINNFIVDRTTNELPTTAVRLYVTSHVDFFHNTIRLTNSSIRNGGSQIFNFANNQNINIYNNLLSTEHGFVFSYNLESTNLNFASDYNAFDLGKGAFYTRIDDLVSWQTTGKDLSSKALHPAFTTVDGYIPQNTLLNFITNPAVSSTTDIDEQPRATNYPTAGASEITRFTNDLAVAGFPFLNVPVPAEEQTATVEITNTGMTAISEFSVHWRWNGTERMAVNWTGNLTSGSSVQVDLGTVVAAIGIENEIFARVQLLADQVTVNDTLTRNNFAARLTGLYTIGAEADFSDLEAALHTLSSVGVAAPVTFALNDGTHYLDDNLFIGNHYGAGAENPLVIRSAAQTATAVTLRGKGRSEDRIQLSTKWLTIEHLTFWGKNDEAQLLGQDSEHLRIANCRFTGSDYYDPYARAPLEFYNCSDVIIENCTFTNRSQGIICVNFPDESSIANLAIRGNDFSNQGMFSLQIENHQNVEIIENQFTSLQLVADAVFIELNEVTGLRMERNTINIGGEQNVVGIQLDNAQTTEMHGVKLINNFINITSEAAVPLQIQNSNGVTILHNTINATAVRSINLVNNTNGQILNNIFYNRVAGYLYYSQDDNSQCDYNNYYAINGGQFYDDAEYIDLASWQSAISSKNANSLTFDPLFTPSESYYLTNLELDNRGIANSNVIDDLENNLRSATTPDLGCFEFDNEPPVVNCASDYELDVVLQNPMIAAADLVTMAEDNSGQEVQYSFHPTAMQTILVANCDQLVAENLQVYITDNYGNQSICTVPVRTNNTSIEFCQCTATDIIINDSNNDLNKNHYRAERTITTSVTVATDQQLQLFASDHITLAAGFNTQLGSTFTATIQDCLSSENKNEITTRQTVTLDSLSAIYSFYVHPNPIVGETNLIYTLPQATEIQLTLLDAYGRLLKTVVPITHQPSGTYQHSVDLRFLAAGVYYFNLYANGEKQVQKIVRLRR